MRNKRLKYCSTMRFKTIPPIIFRSWSSASRISRIEGESVDGVKSKRKMCSRGLFEKRECSRQYQTWRNRINVYLSWVFLDAPGPLVREGKGEGSEIERASLSNGDMPSSPFTSISSSHLRLACQTLVLAKPFAGLPCQAWWRSLSDSPSSRWESLWIVCSCRRLQSRSCGGRPLRRCLCGWQASSIQRMTVQVDSDAPSIHHAHSPSPLADTLDLEHAFLRRPAFLTTADGVPHSNRIVHLHRVFKSKRSHELSNATEHGRREFAEWSCLLVGGSLWIMDQVREIDRVRGGDIKRSHGDPEKVSFGAI